MDYETRYRTISKGLKGIQKELLELRRSLLSDEQRESIDVIEKQKFDRQIEYEEVPQTEDFFAHLIQENPHHTEDELYHAAINLIIERGYASTLVLQQRLGITYRQAMNLIDQLEADGLIGPAHGFRPHKALSAAYNFRERTNY